MCIRDSARAANELNILTVGVITLPFSYEGPKRMRRAMEGWGHLKRHLDASIVVPNQNLFKIANESTTFEKSFSLSNDVLKHGVRNITDLMVRPGLINLDFADVETVMSSMGKAMMGTGEAEGENRAIAATELALNNPLIDDYSLKGAKGLLVNITGGEDIKLFEVDQAVNKIRAEVDPEAELIFGSIEDENLNGKIRVSIVATSLDGQEPEIKPIVSMVHRLHNRNTGYSNNPTSSLTGNQVTLNATEGATALNINNVVTNVIVLAEGDIVNVGLGVGSQWVETFIDGKRGNYAGIGMTYTQNVATMGVASTDIFISTKPFVSWSVGVGTARWYAPISCPALTADQEAAHMSYHWDESAYQADNTKGWVLFDPSA